MVHHHLEFLFLCLLVLCKFACVGFSLQGKEEEERCTTVGLLCSCVIVFIQVCMHSFCLSSFVYAFQDVFLYVHGGV